MSVSTNIVLSGAVIIAVLVGDILCRDASYVRESNWSRVPSWDSPLKASTPWPSLGSYNVNLQPSWVSPPQNSWGRQGSNNNFNTGTNRQPERTTINAKEVTDDELREFSENLLGKDVNNAARHVQINLQSKTTSRSSKDEAPNPLLQIDREAFKIPSIEKMLRLHDNYIVESNKIEEYTNDEKQEEENLLDAVIDTPVMQQTRNFLMEKGAIGQSLKQFKDTLRDIWFTMYARGGGKVGSSGFEHVFLAEIKNNQPSGLHNWLYFDIAEKNSKANYLGYMKKIDLGNKGAIIKFHFTFHGIDKPVGSMFIGTSPEFEMALYTTCFLLRVDKICPLKLNGNRFVIRTYNYRYRGKNMIGSAFPDI